MKKFFYRLWAKRQLKIFQKKAKSPEKEFLRSLKRIQATSKLQQIQGLKSYHDLRELPLTDYTDYREDFRKTLSSKFNPMNGENVHFWATSTGSSGLPKLFPISKSVDQSHHLPSKWRVALLINQYNVYNTAPELMFVMPGESVDFAPNRLVGQIGYYHYQHAMPRWMEKNFTFSKQLYQSKNEFNEWHVLAAVLEDSVGISTSIPARITHFLNQINEQRDELRKIITSQSWPKTLIRTPTKERLSFVIEALKQEIKHPHQIWPTLKFICVWKAGEGCIRQLSELQANYQFNGIEIIDQFYNASEGLFNIPFPDAQGRGGVVNVWGVILEFYDSKTDSFYWPWELEKGKNYELILTNCMGLNRYKTYDMVKCTGHYEALPIIEFESRSFPEISLGWGNISEQQLVDVLNDLSFTQFSEIYFCINKKGNGIELVSHNQQLAELANQVEEGLKKVNPNYASQLDAENFSPVQFSFVSFELFNQKMLEHPNNKRLLIN